ncbi:penicillin-binding protein 2 [Verrucomicrobiaceae bacterium N1E253]|uniref:Beta-lactamase n=1 Tax=Oceaniferula marina TaxID=2748318 RepID=A0A851GLW6_9BACT|nr:penicillin-binding protein 2 [Oceaniferula marina]NWK56155.1 penicillin-binding protein 2 [Oceaniferula marina]
MEPRYRLRLYLLTALILIGFGTLVSRLYQYQITERDRFRKQVPSDYTVTIREPGIRGDITDRNGVTLAKNLRNYEVVFNLEDIRNDYKRYLIESKGEEAVKDFRKIKTHEIVNLWVRPRLALHGLDKPYRASALDTHYITHGGMVPFTFRDDLNYNHFAYFAEHNLELPGVEIRVRPRREYPLGSLASHVLGYVKQWEKGAITPEEKKKYKHYTGDSHGIAGVEATMNRYLTGSEGTLTLLKNEKGKVIREVDRIKPDVGAKVALTIDARIQCLVENSLRHVGRAAAVVMNPNTGEILAMASVPDFTPGNFVPSIDPKAWKNYNSNKAHPLVNKAINNFTPGSTFKLPTAINLCRHGHSHQSMFCPGYVQYGNIKIRCWKTYGHGTLALEESIQRSCNPFFMRMANEMGSQKMLEGYELLGLGHKTGVELPSEAPGIVPGNRYWRQVLRPGASVTPSITGMMAIGQSDCATTPLQMAALVSAIANGGKYYKPRIVKEVTHPHQGKLVRNTPKLKVDLLEKGLSAEDLERIRHGMWLAANKLGGTARRASVKDRDVCAKTGTAQTVDMGIKAHDAWTVAFAPKEQARYVVVVAVHRGEHGGTVAGPLVHLITRGLFAKEDGIKLPIVKMSESQGDFEVREAVELPEEDDYIDIAYEQLANAEDDTGETGNEISELPNTQPILVTPAPHIPKPTIRQQADAAGSRIPKAIIIEE